MRDRVRQALHRLVRRYRESLPLVEGVWEAAFPTVRVWQMGDGMWQGLVNFGRSYQAAAASEAFRQDKGFRDFCRRYGVEEGYMVRRDKRLCLRLMWQEKEE